MSYQSWWQQKSRRSKAITIFATLLILQIGLCFGTPAGVSWFDSLFRIRRNSFDALGYMFLEAIIATVLLLVLLGVLFFYRTSDEEPATLAIAPDEDQKPPDGNGKNDSGR
jgi:ABC-type dipeptide/oligopeptide/nickel transport system permease subunit